MLSTRSLDNIITGILAYQIAFRYYYCMKGSYKKGEREIRKWEMGKCGNEEMKK